MSKTLVEKKESARAANQRYNKTEKARVRRQRYYVAHKDRHRAVWNAKSNAVYHALTPAQKKQRNWKNNRLPTPTRPMPEWCEGCGRLPPDTLCLDHDHVSGKFRGWLCHTCNRALGLLGDDVASVERILAYLRRAR